MARSHTPSSPGCPDLTWSSGASWAALPPGPWSLSPGPLWWTHTGCTASHCGTHCHWSWHEAIWNTRIKPLVRHIISLTCLPWTPQSPRRWGCWAWTWSPPPPGRCPRPQAWCWGWPGWPGTPASEGSRQQTAACPWRRPGAGSGNRYRVIFTNLYWL